MQFFVYVLYSQAHGRTYTGQTEDVAVRLSSHNAGRVRSTKPYRPWVLLHKEGFATRAEAMRREKWFKSRQGREFLRNLVERWLKGCESWMDSRGGGLHLFS